MALTFTPAFSFIKNLAAAVDKLYCNGAPLPLGSSNILASLDPNGSRFDTRMSLSFELEVQMATRGVFIRLPTEFDLDEGVFFEFSFGQKSEVSEKQFLCKYERRIFFTHDRLKEGMDAVIANIACHIMQFMCDGVLPAKFAPNPNA